MKEQKWMSAKPVLNFIDIARRFTDRGYARLFVHRLIKSKKLKRITKSRYTTSEDIFLIASNLYFPGYISFLSASAYYGYTEIIPQRIYIVTAHDHKKIDFEKYSLYFVKLNPVWGYKQDKEGIFIADTEKLLIDVFLKPNYMGNFNEIENIFRNISSIDREKLKNYLKRINSNKIYRQVGYMLEQHQRIDILDLFPINKNYYSLNPFQRGKKLNKKWRLFI